MCNQLHTDSKPIPEKGYGWKIFYRDNRRASWKRGYRSFMVHTNPPYVNKDSDSFYRYTAAFGHGDGFCFFLTEKEAIRTLRFYIDGFSFNPNFSSKLKIKKIEYRVGIGKHKENIILRHNKKGIINKTFNIALCRRFKIVGED